jgi:prophage tail gpP-like protein
VTGELSLLVNGVSFTRFLEYEYTEDYLSPSDTWEFTIAEKELSTEDAAALQPGSTVQLVLNGSVQSTGILDEPVSDVDRSSGTVVRVAGRDWFSVAVDAQVDPQLRFRPSMTVVDLLNTLFGPLGVTVLAEDNILNQNVITGSPRGTPSTKKGKPLKSFLLHQEKPYPNEGTYHFASRICQRFGVWIRPAGTPGTLVVAKPDFEQQPRYGLQHVYSAGSTGNNVERGHFARSRKEQPSIIYASGFGAGGDFAKSSLRSGIVNPVVNADNSAVINAYPSVRLVTIPAVTAAFSPFVEGNPRPAFLYDSESHTQEQLDNYVLRELALRMRKALSARYEIMGHMLGGSNICVDTIVNVNDQRKTVQWQGPLWVLGRKFSKSAKDGTRTVMDLILPGALQF